MENKRINPDDVKGWAIDADPENEPTYPMKKYTGDDHKRLNYERPVLQATTGEELHSNERPNMTAVFGTSVPPEGLSGWLRKFAFRYSENHYGHWLTLMLADRVNVIEALIGDLKKGKIPNIFAEQGGNAQLKYNKVMIAKKLVFTVAFAVAFIWWRKKKRQARLA